ncbi:unnamed protein product [Symbiodinium natans]|uniref:Uncharacterized protein n=1 Tax=Symbiodinium natans TaxID=878477 RepID=A0A812V0U4_9DINO|nr:unnamed protein product [Symbiodinium natans]
MAPEQRYETFERDLCDPILLGFDWGSCAVGYTALAVLCSQLWMYKHPALDKIAVAKEAINKLLPSVESCLPKTPWPLKLAELHKFANDTVDYTDFKLGPEKAALFGASIRSADSATDHALIMLTCLPEP